MSFFYYKKENQTLMLRIDQQQNKTNSQLQELKNENQDLFKKNEELKKENQDLIQSFNVENNNISYQAKTGSDQPIQVGNSPSFTLVSRGGFDRSSRKITLDNLTQGSYQYQKEEIPFDINDMNSWPDLGNWYVSCYTATVEECDSDPSTTASGTLVTPSFTVAVDPNYWQYGTIFYFKGLGFGIAADSGGSVKGKNRADFLVASKTFARTVSGDRQVYLVYTPN